MLEDARQAGDCDSGYSCAYTNNLAWRSETQPLPPILDPRALFERLFGSGAELTLMWSVRAGLVAAAFGVARVLSAPGSAARHDRAVMLMMLAITAVVVAVAFTRRQEVALETPVSLLAVIEGETAGNVLAPPGELTPRGTTGPPGEVRRPRAVAQPARDDSGAQEAAR